jgi:hypothetical protein
MFKNNLNFFEDIGRCQILVSCGSFCPFVVFVQEFLLNVCEKILLDGSNFPERNKLVLVTIHNFLRFLSELAFIQVPKL